MVSFERESRWIRVNGILPESLGELDSRPTSDPGYFKIILVSSTCITCTLTWMVQSIHTCMS